MSQQSHPELQRLLDLLGDRATGNLAEQDSAELDALLSRVPPITDEQGRPVTEDTLGQALGSLVASWSKADDAPLPANLRSTLLARGATIVAGKNTSGGSPDRGGTNSPWRLWSGWLVAAAAIAIAAIGWLRPATPPAPPALTLAQQADALLKNEPDTAVIPWKPQTDPVSAGVSGEVVWNTRLQKGFLRFKGLRQNDPTVEQYQLWMVDATRDKNFPVDGGVFNASGTGEVIIPMNPKLLVRDPAVIAVTIEKPGGVVVTGHERVIVVAPVKG